MASRDDFSPGFARCKAEQRPSFVSRPRHRRGDEVDEDPDT
jgi:hypothetical protein